MPRSWYDFGNVESLLGGNEIDMYELSQILTGIGLVDGLGRTVFFDYFSKGLGGWALASSGGGINPFLNGGGIGHVETLYGNGYSLIMNAGTTSGGISGMARLTYFSNQVRLGLETGYRMYNASPSLRLVMDYLPIGLTNQRMHVMVDHQAQTIAIQTSSGWVTMGSFVRPSGLNGSATQIKVTADWSTGFYRRLFFNERAFDVSTHRLISVAWGDAGTANMSIQATSFGAGSGIIPLGYVRLTKDEP